MNKLKELRLSRNKIVKIDPEWRCLEKLYLDGNEIESIDNQLLLKHDHTLYLNLTNNPLNDSEVKLSENIILDLEKASVPMRFL